MNIVQLEIEKHLHIASTPTLDVQVKDLGKKSF